MNKRDGEKRAETGSGGTALTENAAEANECTQELMDALSHSLFLQLFLAVSCVYSTCRTYIYLHNQEAQTSCHLGSHVDNKMLIKTTVHTGPFKWKCASILLSGPRVQSAAVNMFTGIMLLVIKALTN